MDEDHNTSSKLFEHAHLLLHHLAMVDDELEIERNARNEPATYGAGAN